jgi:hypothetical protein
LPTKKKKKKPNPKTKKKKKKPKKKKKGFFFFLGQSPLGVIFGFWGFWGREEGRFIPLQTLLRERRSLCP